MYALSYCAPRLIRSRRQLRMLSLFGPLDKSGMMPILLTSTLRLIQPEARTPRKQIKLSVCLGLHRLGEVRSHVNLRNA